MGEGVELPTKFKNENVYQLQESIENVLYRFWSWILEETYFILLAF